MNTLEQHKSNDIFLAGLIENRVRTAIALARASRSITHLHHARAAVRKWTMANDMVPAALDVGGRLDRLIDAVYLALPGGAAYVTGRTSRRTVVDGPRAWG